MKKNPVLHNYTTRLMMVSDVTSGACRAVPVVDNLNQAKVGDFLLIQDAEKSTCVRVISHIQEFVDGLKICSFRKLRESEQEEFSRIS